jgi:hypothetical protein
MHLKTCTRFWHSLATNCGRATWQFCSYHYVAIFLVVFGGFAAMGHFLFGMHLASFSSMGGWVFFSYVWHHVQGHRVDFNFCWRWLTPALCRSMLALFKIATGTGDDTSHEHMVQADPAIANLYFLSFIFVVVRLIHCAAHVVTSVSNCF